jgi:hypothetical protein
MMQTQVETIINFLIIVTVLLVIEVGILMKEVLKFRPIKIMQKN